MDGNEQGGGVAAAMSRTLEHARSTLVLQTEDDIKSYSFNYGPSVLYQRLGKYVAKLNKIG